MHTAHGGCGEERSGHCTLGLCLLVGVGGCKPLPHSNPRRQDPGLKLKTGKEQWEQLCIDAQAERNQRDAGAATGPGGAGQAGTQLASKLLSGVCDHASEVCTLHGASIWGLQQQQQDPAAAARGRGVPRISVVAFQSWPIRSTFCLALGVSACLSVCRNVCLAPTSTRHSRRCFQAQMAGCCTHKAECDPADGQPVATPLCTPPGDAAEGASMQTTAQQQLAHETDTRHAGMCDQHNTNMYACSC